jgi:hypothetical protein
MKKLLLVLALVVGSLFQASASHIVGGSIRIQRVSATQIKVIADIEWQDGGPFPSPTETIVCQSVRTGLSTATISTSFVSESVSLPISQQFGSSYLTRRYEGFYTINTSFNDTSGYYFSNSQCCLNAGIVSIANSVSYGLNIVTKTGPFFRNGLPVNNNNPSAVFNDNYLMPLNQATKLWVANQNNTGFDAEGDSLIFSFAPVFSDIGYNTATGFSPLVFNPPFSQSQFLTGAISLNVRTGELNLTPTAQGKYIFAIRMDDYRAGQLLSSVYRTYGITVATVALGTTSLSAAPGWLRYNQPEATLNITAPASGSLQVINSSGQVAKRLSLAAGNQSLSIADLAPGLYVLRGEAGAQAFAQKIVR